MLRELLGSHAWLESLRKQIAERAAGNPFFAEEIVRDLADRGVLIGDPGAYECLSEAAEVIVPANLQAAIGARIDRLAPEAKQVLSAAAVIGSRFSHRLVEVIGHRVDSRPACRGGTDRSGDVHAAPSSTFGTL